MKNGQFYLSVENLTDIIKVIIKDEIVATSTSEKNSISLRLNNGQAFRILIEEV